jgi:chromosome partitioning protein
VRHAVVAVLNSKGGVSKTGISGSLGGTAALSGWETLLIDLDASGDLGVDLGVAHLSDQGAGMWRAFSQGGEPEVLRGVRERLDYIPAGEETQKLYRSLAQAPENPALRYRLAEIIAPLAERYDLVVIDCPPQEEQTQLAILAATRFVLVPSKSDKNSIRGIVRALQRTVLMRSPENPELELLGVVLVQVGRGSKRILRKTRARINESSGGRINLFETVIRYSETGAEACREYGLLPHELEEITGKSWQKLSSERGWGSRLSEEEIREIRRHHDGSGLAEDYQALATSVLAEIRRRTYGEG